ncbi:hypothetical protein FNF28_03403 [Cafeteria roenbergensis]|uniref:N-acylglucosamine 2-epimerase n=1 Tax=Cafeteria roenbergensis TaxID=33653 RepID=A0A5A8DJF6_CAFRO|nr:hypothetical protein FNF28_03403 [Cafeteria roenbergensis]
MAAALSPLAWADALDAELFESVLPFWLAHSEDATNGGFFDCLKADGGVFDRTKHVWLLGREVFMLARIANEATDSQMHLLARASARGPAPEGGDSGAAADGSATVSSPSIRAIEPSREGLLAAARRGLDFLRRHAIDPATGHVWFALSERGEAVAAQRKPFSAAFLSMAMAEVARADRDETLFAEACAWLETFCRWSEDPSLLRGPPPPGAPALSPLNVPMIELNLISELSKFFGDAKERDGWRTEQRAKAVAAILEHWHPELGATLEHCAPGGGVDASTSLGRLHNPGHAIEAGWFVMEEGLRTKNAELVSTGCAMAAASLQAGWDGDLPGCGSKASSGEKPSAAGCAPGGSGGIVYFLDVLGSQPTQLEADMKLWWPVCEAMIALSMQFAATGDAVAMARFDVVARFALEHFSDAKPGRAGPGAGEWVGYLSRDLRVTHSFKGGPYKGCFHVPRALFMVYVDDEGANGQLAVPKSSEGALREALLRLLVTEGDVFQWTPDSSLELDSPEEAFRTLRLRSRPLVAEPGQVRSEVQFDPDDGAAALPGDWHAMLDDAKLVMDCRNYYETTIGTFDTGVDKDRFVPVMTDTHMDAFGVVEDELQRRGVDKDSTVLLACTGGIRCERLVRQLRGKGFSKATALRGGIVAYTNAVREGSLPASGFTGSNYVFDGRGAVPVDGQDLARCQHCGAPAAKALNCSNKACGLVLVQCGACAAALAGACSPACAATSLLTEEARREHAAGTLSMVVRDRVHSMAWGAVSTGLWILDPAALGGDRRGMGPSPAFSAPGPASPAFLARMATQGGFQADRLGAYIQGLHEAGGHEDSALEGSTSGSRPSQGCCGGGGCSSRPALPELPAELAQQAQGALPSLNDAIPEAIAGQTVNNPALRRFAWWAPSQADGGEWRRPERVAPPAHAAAQVQRRVRSVAMSHITAVASAAVAGQPGSGRTCASGARCASTLASASRGEQAGEVPFGSWAAAMEAPHPILATVMRRAEAAWGMRARTNASHPHTLRLLSGLAASAVARAPAASSSGQTGRRVMLDLGTLGGASAAALSLGAAAAAGAAQLGVVSVDLDPKCGAAAAESLRAAEEEAGMTPGALSGRVQFVTASALDAVRAIAAEGRSVAVAFVDAGKRDTRPLLELLLDPEGDQPMLEVGGVLVLDDVLVGERSVQDAEGDPEGAAKARSVLARAGASMDEAVAWLAASPAMDPSRATGSGSDAGAPFFVCVPLCSVRGEAADSAALQVTRVR